MIHGPAEATMWLAGWAVRVLLLITAPIFYLCRFTTDVMTRFDDWSWRAIHSGEMKKPPQPETAHREPQPSAKRFLR
jgi:hypothetical protein